eukprot:179283-Amphidinium_carterae.2
MASSRGDCTDSTGDSCIYILQEATVHNNPCFFAQLRNLLGMATQSSSRSNTTKLFVDIGRYEADNCANTITDHVKIATIVNSLKGPIGQQ